MSVIYYPKDSVIYKRDTTTAFGEYEQVALEVSPNTIIYFDTSSNLNYISASTFYLTASNALSSVSTSYSLNSTNLYGDAYIVNQIDTDITKTSPSWQEGRLFYDKDNHTWALFNDQPDVTLQLGQEAYVRVIADEYIPNGSPVYISGVSGNYPLVRLSLALNPKSKVIGVSTQTIISGNEGFITIQGKVNDVNTSAFLAGDLLYLSHLNSGSFVNYAPPDPYDKVAIATCIISNALSGKLLVNIQQHSNVNIAYVSASLSSSYSLTSSYAINADIGSRFSQTFMFMGG